LKVSIITVVWNNVSTVAEAIESVLNQSYSNIEYIIVDGKSNDGTVEVIEKYANKIDTFISEKDNGLYDAMNKGIQIATGDIIGFINADDVINSNNCVEEIVKKFESTNADVVYGDKIYVDPQNPSKVVRYWKSGEFNRNSYKKGWMTPHLSTYIKKDLYNKFGGFRGDFKIAADYELMLRFIYKQEAKTHYLPMVIAKMRAGGLSNGSLKNVAISNYEVYKSWKVNGLSISPLIAIQKPMRKLAQLFKRN
tara:strand:- start:6426 stop:7178 length:753 start_codon:yes stop_codon:yes gene_type:complete